MTTSKKDMNWTREDLDSQKERAYCVCVVDFFVPGKHVRRLNLFGLCATFDALIVAFHTSDGWIILNLYLHEN